MPRTTLDNSNNSEVINSNGMRITVNELDGKPHSMTFQETSCIGLSSSVDLESLVNGASVAAGAAIGWLVKSILNVDEPPSTAKLALITGACVVANIAGVLAHVKLNDAPVEAAFAKTCTRILMGGAGFFMFSAQAASEAASSATDTNAPSM